MSKQEYSSEEIVRAFKFYVSKVVKNAAIDYARKVKSQKYREILFSDCVDERVSLSDSDSGTLFSVSNDIVSIDIKLELHNFASKLNKQDKLILELCMQKKTNQQIAKILNLNEKTIRNKKSLLKKKLKERLNK